jgi:hypothetical protein
LKKDSSNRSYKELNVWLPAPFHFWLRSNRQTKFIGFILSPESIESASSRVTTIPHHNSPSIFVFHPNYPPITLQYRLQRFIPFNFNFIFPTSLRSINNNTRQVRYFYLFFVFYVRICQLNLKSGKMGQSSSSENACRSLPLTLWYLASWT